MTTIKKSYLNRIWIEFLHVTTVGRVTSAAGIRDEIIMIRGLEQVMLPPGCTKVT